MFSRNYVARNVSHLNSTLIAVVKKAMELGRPWNFTHFTG